MKPPAARRILTFAAAGVAFVLLATANGAGYRYGVSDQAFYIPVIMRALDPSLFPLDGALLDAEGRLMLVDEVLASIVRVTGISIESLFLSGYLVSLALLWLAVVLVGRRLSRSVWAFAAFGAVVTMRHRIPRTSANSFEPYFHPRMLAFALGALATAAMLRRRPWAAVTLVAIAALIHVTTALWFGVLLGVAIAVADPRWKRLGIAAGVGAGVVLAAIAAGPLRGALTVMDETWLQAVASKDSLFPTEWPIWAWAANLALLPILWWTHRVRIERGVETPEDKGLLWGAAALVGLFLVTLPAVAAGVSLAVQFQISRVFWVVEFVTAAYLTAALAMPLRRAVLGATSTPRRALEPAIAVALTVVAFAVVRGAYVMMVERPERALFDARLPSSDWEDAMAWLKRQPASVHVLADPGHAWKYGTSVRVAAARDVLLEEVKDSALAIYSREVAVRVVERTAAIGDFAALSSHDARGLAQKYDLAYLVIDREMPLTMAYRNDRFRIYSLK